MPFFRTYGWLLMVLFALPGWAQTAPPVTAPLDVAAIDAIVTRTLKAFEVPGIAVAVVKDGQVVLSKGYGVRSLKSNAPMDAHTLVGIGSKLNPVQPNALRFAPLTQPGTDKLWSVVRAQLPRTAMTLD